MEDDLQKMLDELSWQARERNMLVPKHHLNLGELVGQGIVTTIPIPLLIDPRQIMLLLLASHC